MTLMLWHMELQSHKNRFLSYKMEVTNEDEIVTEQEKNAVHIVIQE